jgi:hypothetical protein
MHLAQGSEIVISIYVIGWLEPHGYPPSHSGAGGRRANALIPPAGFVEAMMAGLRSSPHRANKRKSP